MKLICVDTLNYNDIKLGEIYEGYPSDDSVDTESYFRDGWFIELEDKSKYQFDFTMENWFPLKCFMILGEWREKRIDEILDEQ